MSRDLVSFMLPCPHEVNKTTVRSTFQRLGFGLDHVKVWGELNAVFIKKVGYLSNAEYKLFLRVMSRLGATYRLDYKLWVIRVNVLKEVS